MSIFTLAISCLTTSNLPWFMDLTFQVPMQYCSLQHWTLLLSLVPSTTGYCFCFGSMSSFFLKLVLHWFPVAYWAPPTWGVHLSVSYLFAFSYCSWGSQGKNTEVVCHSKTSYPLNSLSLFPPPPRLWQPPIFSISINILILNISYTCNHIICDFFVWLLLLTRASLVFQLVKNPPAMQETSVWSQGWEDPLEEEKATHSSILAWRIPWTV